MISRGISNLIALNPTSGDLSMVWFWRHLKKEFHCERSHNHAMPMGEGCQLKNLLRLDRVPRLPLLFMSISDFRLSPNSLMIYKATSKMITTAFL